jgi:hypothetical protein
VAQALREQKGAINEASIAAAAKDAEDQGLLDKADQLGIKLPMVTSAILGQGTALQDLRGKLQGIVSANTEVDTSTGTAVTSLNSQGQAAQNMLNDLNGLVGGKDRDTAADKRRAAATQGVAVAQTGALPANDLYKAAINATGAEFDESADAGQQLANAIKGIADQQVSGIEAEEAYKTALRTMRTEINGSSNSLNINTATGQRNRDMLQDVASKIRDKTLADIQSGMPMNQALARHNQRIAALKKEAGNTFANKKEVDKLVNSYGEVPRNVKTKLEQIGYSEIRDKMMDLSARQFLLERGKPATPANIRAINLEKRYGRGHATGGEIQGPGGPTSDSVPIWASAGEFMQRAKAVDYYGVPFMRALNERRIPKGAIQGLAQGGPVSTWPFKVDLSKTKIPSPPVVAVSGAAAGSPAVVAAVRAVAARYGWGSGAQWNALSALISHESGWNPSAANPTSSARGLFQKLTSMHGPLESTVGGQAMWGLNYIRGRYGSPAAAWSAWNSRSPHWYDDGGSLRPGVSTVVNNTGRPEQVLTPAERDAFIAQARAAARDTDKPPVVKNFNLHAHVTNRPVDLVQEFRRMELMENLT